MKSGFTLIEMIAVLLIIAILAAATTAGLASARDKAWRTQARETCRELCEAWQMYLLDERSFPDELKDEGLAAVPDNLKYLVVSETDVKGGKCYLELNAKEFHGSWNKEDAAWSSVSGEGLKDHWGRNYMFTLDTDYDGKVTEPVENTTIVAPVIAWSTGKRPEAKQKWIISWSLNN